MGVHLPVLDFGVVFYHLSLILLGSGMVLVNVVLVLVLFDASTTLIINSRSLTLSDLCLRDTVMTAP